MQRIYAAAIFALFATQAQAADLLYISEYNAIGGSGQVQVASEPATVDQVTADFTSAAVQSSAFQANTSIVRLICNVQCSVLFGTNPTATNANKVLPALIPEYFYVQPGQSYKISVHTNP
jgi:hypothetical protein